MTQSEILNLAADCARYRAALISILDAESAETERRDDAIRDMLDIACGWCRPMSEAEKLQMIESVGTAALDVPFLADASAQTPVSIAAEALGFPFSSRTPDQTTTERSDRS